MTVWIYNFVVTVYKWAIHLAAIFNAKANLWVKGRANIFEKMQAQISPHEKIVWIHCASLGEFEQGRPLIEKIKSTTPHLKILLTFFSPSGYEIRKNYQQADYIFYLPADAQKNAEKLLSIVNPSVAIFVKYEFWYHYLHELHQRKIPTFLVAAIFRKDQIFFKSYGSFFKNMLGYFDHIFVQNEFSKTILLQNGIKSVSNVGDTRVDRVLQIKKSARAFDVIQHFKGTADLLIGGSTWPPDENILIQWIHKQQDPKWKFIFAPHDISAQHLVAIESKLKISSIRYSQATPTNAPAAHVMIIDNIGMLSSLYQYGKVAYIGGGFGAGIHNTLEPIAFGLPVVFGKKYKKFEEANVLVSTQGGFTINNYEDFERLMKELAHQNFYAKASQAATAYLLKNQGATAKIFTKIESCLPRI
ncbi:MAG: glycosyltransferase N-terminal domain-containing protein [Bacteroidota bacterium]